VNAAIQTAIVDTLGASRAAAAVGQSPWQTPYQLYLEMLGQLPANDPNAEDPLYLEMGEVLEPVAIRRLEKRLKVKVTDRQLKVIDPSWPRRHVTMDGRINDEEYVEAKSTGFADPAEWGDEEEEDAVPMQYYLQCQHGMACNGCIYAWMPLIVTNRQFRIYRVRRNDAVIESLTAREREFMARVDAREPPPMTSLDDVKIRWPSHVEHRRVTATSEIARLVRRHARNRRLLKAAESRRDALQLAIATFMAESAELVDVAGESLATFKQAKSSKKFNEAQFALDNPQVYARYLKDVPGSRRFLNKVK